MMDSIYPSLTKNEGWRQTKAKTQPAKSKNLQSFTNSNFGQALFRQDAGSGIGSKNSQPVANSPYVQEFGEDTWTPPASSPWGSKNLQSFANSPYGRSSGQDAGNGIEVEYDDGWGDGLKFYVSNKHDDFGTRQRDFYFFQTSELTRIGIDTVKQQLAKGIVPKVPKEEEEHEPKNIRPFGNCSFGKGFQADQRAQRDRQQEEKDRQAFNWASESEQRALKDRKQEQFVRSPFNWAAPCDACSDDGSSNASAKGKNGGKKKHPWSNWTSPWKAGSADASIGRDAVTGKFGLLQAEQRAQKKSWEEFLPSNLASGPWEGIIGIGGKKKHSSFNNWSSAWDAGSDDGSSSNASAKGKNGAKKKHASFKSVSPSNAGDSDAGSSKASAKGKNWWELDYCAPSTAGDSGDSDDGSNSDSNASANSKNGGKKKKADGNVNVHICGCCIFI